MSNFHTLLPAVTTGTANSRQKQAVRFFQTGYKEQQMLEILLAMAVKLISNYSNHRFAAPVDDAFAAYTWSES